MPTPTTLNILRRMTLSLCLLAQAMLAAEPTRTFTDVNGRRIQAALVSVSGDEVTLRLANGQPATVNVNRLSAEDRRYISGMPPTPAGAAEQNPAGASYGGMALRAGWSPEVTYIKRELLESVTFYAKAVLGDKAPGKETTPGQLSNGITWLMPFDKAVATLPSRVIKMGERTAHNNCFPAGSLTISSFQYKSFIDQGRPFNLLHLLLDAKRQVVGMEYVQQTPGRTAVYDAEGKLEPYFNFFTLANNASTGREVVYAILPGGGSGVRCIQTVYRDFANMIPNGLPQAPGGRPGYPMVDPATAPALMVPVKVHEIVHWYLAEPFARCLLDIAEKNGVVAK